MWQALAGNMEYISPICAAKAWMLVENLKWQRDCPCKINFQPSKKMCMENMLELTCTSASTPQMGSWSCLLCCGYIFWDLAALETAYDLAGELWVPGSCLASPVLAWCGKDVGVVWGRVIKWLVAAGGLFVLLLLCWGVHAVERLSNSTPAQGEKEQSPFFIWLGLFRCVQPSVVLL